MKRVGLRRTVALLSTGGTAAALALTALPGAAAASTIAAPTILTAAAPSTTFQVSTRIVNYSRGSRTLPTKIYYPATSSSSNASVASGTFPFILFSHGLGGTYDTYRDIITPLAAAGFIVASPEYQGTKAGGGNAGLDDVTNGNQMLDASQVITNVLALNTKSGDPLKGHIDAAAGVGAAGHSAGGYTTYGLISSKRDARITTAATLAGWAWDFQPSGSPVKTLMINGDKDATVDYQTLAIPAFQKIPSSWPRAFFTHIGGTHDNFIWPPGTNPYAGWPGSQGFSQTVATLKDWFRWGLYGDTAARDRLASDATSGGKVKWEPFGLGSGTTTPPPSGGSTTTLVGKQSGRCADITGAGTANGALAELWDCNGGTNQKFTLTSAKTLQVLGKCLDVAGQGTSPGTAVQLWDCNGQTNQQWSIGSDGTVKAVQSGLCLDASGKGTTNGTALDVWTCNGQSNQQWTRS